MHISNEQRTAKLNRLVADWGYETLVDLLGAVTFDTVSPGICVTEGCHYSTEVEPDQREGYCEACGTQTVQSALVLADIL